MIHDRLLHGVGGDPHVQRLDPLHVENHHNIWLARFQHNFYRLGNLHGGGNVSSKPPFCNEAAGMSHTSPRRVFSIRPLTICADFSSSSHTSAAVIIGVFMFFAAFIISLIRGTPRVTSGTESRDLRDFMGSKQACMQI